MSMEKISAEEIRQAVQGNILSGEKTVLAGNISLDSRNTEGNALFVPIIGERTDAHNFICQAAAGGAAVVFTSRHHTKEEVEQTIESQCEKNPQWKEAANRLVWIEVEDTRLALQALGAYLRTKHAIPLVGITGSVGKTTTREMIASALSAGFSVYKTPGNSNSQVGVPITIANIPADAQIGVIELGMSEPGEMTRIAKVAQVDSAVMTNIGITHIEQLGSQENILKEKLHIQDGMKEDGILFLNGDDTLLSKVVPEKGRKKVLYGLSETCDYRGVDMHLEDGYPVFTAVHGKERVQVCLRVMGGHMVSNALAALAVAGEYGISMEKAAEALMQFEGFKGRQDRFEAGGVTVIDDSYNASPVSMKAGLDVLASLSCTGRRIAVLADMKELGPETVAYHREIGEHIKGLPIDALVLFGELAGHIGERLSELKSQVCLYRADSLEDICQWLDRELVPGDAVLLKGSNSMGLSKVAQYLKNSRVK